MRVRQRGGITHRGTYGEVDGARKKAATGYNRRCDLGRGVARIRKATERRNVNQISMYVYVIMKIYV
jgi:hypothetical protein